MDQGRRREDLLGDQEWSEVHYINSYAAFMAYVSMAIKGLGFLVLTWTTVVLLGGFVSMLHKKDFWCLTFITLVQTAGIFDVVLKEKLSYMMYAVHGLLAGVCLSVMGHPKFPITLIVRLSFACLMVLLQAVVLVVILCPLAIIYMFGIPMSAGISLWRLIEHDYERNSNGEASNLAPAMDTLYYLALLQGVLYCYRFVSGSMGKTLVKHEVIFGQCDESELEVVSDYLCQTTIICEKDPSFMKGRSLITHAVNKIGSSSPANCISGVKSLYTAICIVEREVARRERRKGTDNYRRKVGNLVGQRMLMKHLVVYASSSKMILAKLLETLDSIGLHDTETRKHAAKIVELLALNINLEEFPEGIQHISSLIETFQEYSIAEPYYKDFLYDKYEYNWKQRATRAVPSPAGDHGKAYRSLLFQGMCILRKLATKKNNCRVMSDTPGLVSKIMAPVASDLLHHTTDDHGEWSLIVEGSLDVMRELTCAPGETGAKLCHEISSCQGAVSTLWRIINCSKCNEGLQCLAIWILGRIYVRAKSSSSADSVLNKEKSSNMEDFVRMLVGILMSQNKYSFSTRACAGESLSQICSCDGVRDAAVAIKRSCDVDSLTEVLLHDKYKICRQAAAKILEYLCSHNMKNDEYLGKLKKSILEVIGDILCSREETHNETDEFAQEKFDIESQYDGTQRINEQDKEEKEFQASMQSIRSTNLLSSLLSLFRTVYSMTPINDLAPRLDASGFLNKLKEVALKKSDHPTVEDLMLFKSISKMVISMMEHNSGRFIEREYLGSLIEALSSASKNIMDLDHSMVFRSSSSSESSKLDKCTLASLIKELHAKMPSTSGSG